MLVLLCALLGLLPAARPQPICSNPNAFLYNGGCYASCAATGASPVYRLGFTCWDACPPEAPFVGSGNTCVACTWTPPSNLTYFDAGTSSCLESCNPIYAFDPNRTCETSCPSAPIRMFKDNVYYKCVERCPSNPSRFANLDTSTCVTDCPAPTWAQSDTRTCLTTCPVGTYYQEVGTTRICTRRCAPNLYADLTGTCVAAANCPPLYYGDDTTNVCVRECPSAAGTYASGFFKKCVVFCEVGSFGDSTTKQCLDFCPAGPPRYYGSSLTRQCLLQCNVGQFADDSTGQCVGRCPNGSFGDYSTRRCVIFCPANQSTFADSSTNLCISLCPPNTYANNDTRSCVPSVNCSQNFVGDPLTLKCIDPELCPIGYFVDEVAKLCVTRCPNSYWANLDTRICSLSCQWQPPGYVSWYDSSTRTCAQLCPSNPRTFSANSTQTCQTTCPTGYYGSVLTYECVQVCPAGYYVDAGNSLCVSNCTTAHTVILYRYNQNSTCLSQCPDGFYADNLTLTCVQTCPEQTYAHDGNNTCLPGCPPGFYGDDYSQVCVEQCPALTLQYADDSTNMCVFVCPVVPDYFGEDLNDGNRKCVAGCSLSSQFADPVTRTCVDRCNSTLGYFGDAGTRRCYIRCPSTLYGNPLTGRCTARCPESPIQMFGDNTTKICVTKCPNQTYGSTTLEMCVNATACPAGQFADDSTNKCVPRCPSLLRLFGDPDTNKCVLSCPFGRFADNTTRKCETTCNTTTTSLFKDPSTKSCVSICPTLPALFADSTSMTCVATCSGTQYRLTYTSATETTRKCVSVCPTSPSFFADEQTRTCVQTCAPGTFRFFNNTYRGCLSACPARVLTPTLTVVLFADTTTWRCVAVCPSGFFAFAHPSNSSIRTCVRICPMVGSTYYFGQVMSRSCVTSCPLALHNTYGDRISMSCVAFCPRNQYRDNSTKQCTYACGNSTYADNTTWRCVNSCPSGYYAYDGNWTCLKHCPKDLFEYERENKCVSSCTQWRYYASNITWRCAMKCPSQPDYYANWDDKSCVVRCPSDLFADLVTRSCVSSSQCRNNTVADPVTRRCSARCSIEPMHYAHPVTLLCAPTCNQSRFADNVTGMCVDGCPSPYFGVNTTANFLCVQFCPNNHYKFVNTTSLFRICLPTATGCPADYFADDLTMQCVQVCPDNYYGNTTNKKCVTDCSPLFQYDNTKLCVGVCPSPWTANSNNHRCEQKCDYGQYEEAGVCVDTCANASLFADNLTRECTPTCPDDPFTFSDTSNATDKRCVFQCESGLFAYAQNRTCLPSCPPGYFKQISLRLCLNPCLYNQFADTTTSTCESDCLDPALTFRNPFTRACVDKCPQSAGLFGLNDQLCVVHCPTGKFAQNQTRTCLDKCPNATAGQDQGWADNLTHRCVRVCSALSYAYTNQTDNLCVNDCPGGLFASEIDQACVPECPNGTFAESVSHRCVQRCPNGQYGDTFTKTCGTSCSVVSQLKDKSKNLCVDDCPQYPSMFADNNLLECVLTCPPLFFAYIDNRTCLSDCPSPYFEDESSRSCVTECPIFNQTYADQMVRKCVPACTNYSSTVNGTTVTTVYYADNSTRRCVTRCPSAPQKLFAVNETNRCVQMCPETTYGDIDSRICLDHCIFANPKFTWKDEVNNFCVTLCPIAYFADNLTISCELTCSGGYYANNSTRRCVATCPVSPASYGHNAACVFTCPSPLFADQITRNCVPECPRTPFVYYHYTPTNKCVRNCIYPYFAEIETYYCVNRCKDGFYGNLTTYRCEACRSQCVTCSAYLQCLSCTSDYFLYRYECVTSCPQYPVMYYADLSSSICYEHCPAPYFGRGDTGLCQLSCPVLSYGNPVTRVCTFCPSGCLTCDAGGCYTCLDNYTYVSTSLSCSLQCNTTHYYYFGSSCYMTCPNGTYLSVQDLVTCLACSEQCATCSVSASVCTRCAKKFLSLDKCVDACQSDYFVDENMACVACALRPAKCVLPPLSYKVFPFTQNFRMHAYVIFNRVVDLTLDQFNSIVQIRYNGVTVKPNSFTLQFYNTTTYWITFINSSSLNENSLTIGFQPGSILDMFGNYLTVNQISTSFQAQTGVTEQISQSSTKVTTATQVLSWVLLALVLLFLLKGGYPFLISLECFQIIYMFIFIRLDPIPYLQLEFLKVFKNFHFLFLPSFFPGPTSGYTIKQYQSFITNTSFLFNVSPLIVVMGFALVVYVAFKIMANRKYLANKPVRQLAKKIRKYRLKYSLLNDAVWSVYIYAMFMSMLQFTQPSVASVWDTVNILVAVAVFIGLLVYSIGIAYMGIKYRKLQAKIPRKWNFLQLEPTQFPLEMPLRYLRRFIICCALLSPSVQVQCIVIIIACLFFLMYLLCYMPSESTATNTVNIIIEGAYIVLAGMFYGYNRLVNKTIDEQVGFSIGMIAIQCAVLLTLLVWVLYRGVQLIRETETWKRIYAKLTENTDPEYLKQVQRRKDLEFDWGEFENRSGTDIKTDMKVDDQSSKAMRVPKDIAQEKRNVFDIEYEDKSEDEKDVPARIEKVDNRLNLRNSSRKNKVNIKEQSESLDGSSLDHSRKLFAPSSTQKIKVSPSKKYLMIDNKDHDHEHSDINGVGQDSKINLNDNRPEQPDEPEEMVEDEQIITAGRPAKNDREQGVKKSARGVNKGLETKPSKGKVAVWDDIEFDEDQI